MIKGFVQGNQYPSNGRQIVTLFCTIADISQKPKHHEHDNLRSILKVRGLKICLAEKKNAFQKKTPRTVCFSRQPPPSQLSYRFWGTPPSYPVPIDVAHPAGRSESSENHPAEKSVNRFQSCQRKFFEGPWVWPPPGNSDHQDDITFLVGDPYKPSFATGILGGGHTQDPTLQETNISHQSEKENHRLKSAGWEGIC